MIHIAESDTNRIKWFGHLGNAGLDLLQAMQGRLPIIVVSGHNTLADRVIAQELGAFRYFPKPLEPFALIDAIRAGLDCQEARDEE